MTSCSVSLPSVRKMTGIRFRAIALLVGLSVPLCAAAGDKSSDKIRTVDYLSDVKPILAIHCTKCHGAEKQQSGLRLDSVALAKRGGDSGPAIDPGKSTESLLIRAIVGGDDVAAMPPDPKARLSNDQIALLKNWIDQGAKGPSDEVPAGDTKISPVKGANHWAFKSVVRPAVPEVANQKWVRNAIDAFILARLEREGLSLSPEADRVTLLRRVTFDLVGLPPTIEEVDAFVNDPRSNAYELLVDRLLSSSQYGERWGRHWLDLARYADSNGFSIDSARSMWKYRDWVTENINKDKPFNQFTIEQIAGDMLPDATIEQRIATGFHRNTATNEEGGVDPEQFRVDMVVDRINTTGIVFLGLTVGCAQCHDHKYDPVSQREYYQLLAFLNSSDDPQLEMPNVEPGGQGISRKRAELRRRLDELGTQFDERSTEFQQDLDRWVKGLTDEDKKHLPIQARLALVHDGEMRSEQDNKDLVDYYKTLAAVRKKFPVLDEITKLRASDPQLTTTTLVIQERERPRETNVHIRGDFLRPGARVQPGIPAILPQLAADITSPSRLDFARWLVDPRNPLTPRVTINRVWEKYFGRGIVETENDFGTQGSPPTHPELLDWLAAEFVAPILASEKTDRALECVPPGNESNGVALTFSRSVVTEAEPWSLKHMHRLIVNSATYRQSSRHRPETAGIDAANRLLSRQSRLRLDAEIIRDAALAAGGLLNLKQGGPSVHPPQPDGVFDLTQVKKTWNTETGPDRYRRGMYTHLWRSSPYPAMTVFDFPDAHVTCTRRNCSNTPLQSLTLANDPQFVEIAQGLAASVLKKELADDAAHLRYAFRLCLAREPAAFELQRLEQMLAQQRLEFAANLKEAERLTPPLILVQANVQEFAAWTAVARVLLNLDEFITRE